MKKRIITLLMTIIIIPSIISTTLASTLTPQAAADELNCLGLFQGTDKGYELDRAPTRQEAITILVRLIGKEDEALNGSWKHPFTDVDVWAQPYVGYAYVNGISSGTGATTFGSTDTVSATQYLTFVLRALGYVSGTDFQWDRAWELTDRIGITNGEYGVNSTFLRGDVAIVSYNALNVDFKDKTGTLMARLESGSAGESVATVGNNTVSTSGNYELPVVTADSPLYIPTADGIEARLIDGQYYVYKTTIERKLKDMGHKKRYTFFVYDFYDEQERKKLIENIPVLESNSEYIPLWYYYSTILPLIELL